MLSVASGLIPNVTSSTWWVALRVIFHPLTGPVNVKDVVDVILFLMAERPESGLYNLGTGKARTFADLVTSTFRAMEREPSISFVDTPEDIRDKYQYFTEANMNKLDSHHFIEICKEFPQQCELRGVAEIDKNIATHFVIMDKIGFRFCPDREGTSAFASFNQPKAATNLVNQFKLLFNRAISLVPA